MTIPYDYEAYQCMPKYCPSATYPLQCQVACKPEVACQPEVASQPKCKPKSCVSSCKNLSGAANIPVINITAAAPVPRTLGTISVDLNCFNKPAVKLDLSVLIIMGLATDVSFTITFRVFKRCDNQPEAEFDSYDFTEVNPIGAGTTIPIHFNVCDCESCPNSCCTYRIVVEGTALAAITEFFSVNQGVLSILAGEQCP